MVELEDHSQPEAEGGLAMPRKKSDTPYFYRTVASSRLTASPVEISESGNVRLGLLLEAIAEALHEFPEAQLALTNAIAVRLGANPETRILP